MNTDYMIGIYSDLDYNDPLLWKYRMECKPKYYERNGWSNNLSGTSG